MKKSAFKKVKYRALGSEENNCHDISNRKLKKGPHNLTKKDQKRVHIIHGRRAIDLWLSENGVDMSTLTSRALLMAFSEMSNPVAWRSGHAISTTSYPCHRANNS